MQNYAEMCYKIMGWQTLNFHQSWGDLAVEATFEACKDAGIDLHEIEAAWLGSYRPWIAGERNIGS